MWQYNIQIWEAVTVVQKVQIKIMFNSEWMHVLVYQLHGVINRVIFFKVVFPIKWLVLPVTSLVVPPCWFSVSSWGSVWD